MASLVNRLAPIFRSLPTRRLQKCQTGRLKGVGRPGTPRVCGCQFEVQKDSREEELLHPGLGWTSRQPGWLAMWKRAGIHEWKHQNDVTPQKKTQKKKHSLKLLGFVEGRLIGGGCGSLKGWLFPKKLGRYGQIGISSRSSGGFFPEF